MVSRPLPAAVYWRRRGVLAVGFVAIAWLLIAGVTAALDGGSDTPPDSPATVTAAETPVPASPAGNATPAEGPPPETPGGTGPAATSAPGSAAPVTVAPATTVPTGQFLAASGETGLVGAGRTYRYRVEVEDGSGVPADAFASDVDRILGDPRGWTTADGISLQRVEAGTPADFAVRLATPPTTDALCAPLETRGQVSCGTKDMAVINLRRWLEGDDDAHLDLTGYRAYLISHEVGHLLGHAHEECAGPGQQATTMMQQTLSIGECTPNPWPTPDA